MKYTGRRKTTLHQANSVVIAIPRAIPLCRPHGSSPLMVGTFLKSFRSAMAARRGCSATAFTPPSLVRSDSEAVFMASYDVIRRRGTPSSISYGGIYPMTWYIICANEFPHPAPPSNIFNVEPMWKAVCA